MRKITIIIGLLCLTVSILTAQNVRINGSTTNAVGKKIRLFTYTDYISELPKKLDETIIDASGKFTLKTSIGDTYYAWLQIDQYKAELYLEPNNEYSITILPFDFASDEKIAPFMDKRKLQIEFNNPSLTDLNQLTARFNVIYNDFILTYFNDLYKRRDKSKLDTLNNKITKEFQEVNNAYFNNYIKYRIAGIEQMGSLTSQKKLYQKYIENKPILYNNIEYMIFFLQFYEKFIFNGNHNVNDTELKHYINETKDYTKLMDSLGVDNYVRNEVVREIVFLQGMKDIYYSKKYDESGIIEILRKFSVKSKFKEHKQIAQNLIASFNSLNIGSRAPDFKLQDIKGKVYTLNSFKGKYTYLCFFTTWCGGCMPEVEAIRALKAKYNKDFNFVCISIDKEIMTLDFYLQKKKYDWYFLHYGGNIELLENYSVSTFPIFLLLDKEGNILKYPAIKPSEDIEKTFKELITPETSEKKE